MPEIRPEICRGMWAALASARMQTMDDLQIVTGIPPEEFWPYVDLLWREGYLGLVTIRRAASGEAILVFRLAKHTGPQAPYLAEAGRFVDPNIKEQSRRYWGAFPSLRARMRVAAERLGQFTRDELMRAIGVDGNERQLFTQGWTQLKHEGGLQMRTGDQYAYELPTHATAVREFFRSNTGQDIRSRDVKTAEQPGQIGASTKRLALDLLAAEGYRVSIRPARLAGEDTIYRADAPEGEETRGRCGEPAFCKKPDSPHPSGKNSK